jgi:hypothetical protein
MLMLKLYSQSIMFRIPLYDQFTRENNKDTEDIYEDLDDFLEDLRDCMSEVGTSGCSDDKEEEVHHDNTHNIAEAEQEWSS